MCSSTCESLIHCHIPPPLHTFATPRHCGDAGLHQFTFLSECKLNLTAPLGCSICVTVCLRRKPPAKLNGARLADDPASSGAPPSLHLSQIGSQVHTPVRASTYSASKAATFTAHATGSLCLCVCGILNKGTKAESCFPFAPHILQGSAGGPAAPRQTAAGPGASRLGVCISG
jgi:hypothetical protein